MAVQRGERTAATSAVRTARPTGLGAGEAPTHGHGATPGRRARAMTGPVKTAAGSRATTAEPTLAVSSGAAMTVLGRTAAPTRTGAATTVLGRIAVPVRTGAVTTAPASSDLVPTGRP